MLPLKTRVKTKATVKPARFADRPGFVVSINKSDAPYIEYGVNFGSRNGSARPQAWFAEQELEPYSIPATSSFTDLPDFNLRVSKDR